MGDNTVRQSSVLHGESRKKGLTWLKPALAAPFGSEETEISTLSLVLEIFLGEISSPSWLHSCVVCMVKLFTFLSEFVFPGDNLLQLCIREKNEAGALFLARNNADINHLNLSVCSVGLPTMPSVMLYTFLIQFFKNDISE